MPNSFVIPSRRAGLACCALLAASHAQAVTLYDGNLGSQPSAQDWAAVVPPFASETLINGGVRLDTEFSNSLQAGYALSLPNVDSNAGYSLKFTVQLNTESHSGNSNRAGFSVILLDNVHQGIELGFWTTRIWAQAVGFTSAEGISFNTTQLTEYVLTLQAGRYTLSVNTTPILDGIMRDYAAFGAPYNLSNFLFMGDNTTSAKARVQINQVADNTTLPLPATGWLMLAPILSWGFKQAWCRGIAKAG